MTDFTASREGLRLRFIRRGDGSPLALQQPACRTLGFASRPFG